MLNDVRAMPALDDPRASVGLVVPSMDMVGELREQTTPEPGKTYWMTFANTGGWSRPATASMSSSVGFGRTIWSSSSAGPSACGRNSAMPKRGAT